MGCGGIGLRHMEELAKNPYVSLVAFCDLDVNKAKVAAEKFGIRDTSTFSDAEEMFDKIEIDAAYFCVPPYAHGSEMTVIERGIPFFIEKPVDLDLKRVRRIASAIEKRGLLTSVGYMNRYRRGVQLAKETFKDDPPILVLGGWIRKEMSGGQIS